MKENYTSFILARTRFNERVSFDQEASVLLSFSTGLFSVGDGSVDKINCDKVKFVGIMMQEKLCMVNCLLKLWKLN